MVSNEKSDFARLVEMVPDRTGYEWTVWLGSIAAVMTLRMLNAASSAQKVAHPYSKGNCIRPYLPSEDPPANAYFLCLPAIQSRSDKNAPKFP
ncbi:hypothetical protein T11_5824 [Trichinella zimbabwensis]|uniref:Uncharacterized protein n=1 Tax=Trichinella zimbabwensis TaxID=268475 RepID=A0A0V1GVI7_9BILA|nr:hypothetical protein T11_5824 [Trichinella zimbabwensis]